MNESVDANEVIELYKKKVAELTHEIIIRDALILKIQNNNKESE